MVGPRHDRRSGAQRRSGTFRARSTVLLIIPFLLAAVLLISAERRWQSVAKQSLAKRCECEVGIWIRPEAAQPRKLSPGIAAALPPLPALRQCRKRVLLALLWRPAHYLLSTTMQPSPAARHARRRCGSPSSMCGTMLRWRAATTRRSAASTIMACPTLMPSTPHGRLQCASRRCGNAFNASNAWTKLLCRAPAVLVRSCCSSHLLHCPLTTPMLQEGGTLGSSLRCHYQFDQYPEMHCTGANLALDLVKFAVRETRCCSCCCGGLRMLVVCHDMALQLLRVSVVCMLGLS